MPTRTWNYTGDWERWDVPDDVEVVDVEMTGGGAGGREGGKVVGQIRVKGIKAVWIQVGRRAFAADGRNGGEPCFGGGGAGGRGGPGKDGGSGGGGASAIRFNRKDGQIRAVAAGAGGKSGDGSTGGAGGAEIGQEGTHDAAPGSTMVGKATGGTQNQGGKGGTIEGYKGLWGGDANNTLLARGGRGGQSDTLGGTHGGGGGGGGYRAGGGGQAALIGTAPGGGGGGGSNYTGGMFGAQSFRGTGGTDNGSVTFTWTTSNPPQPPSAITIDGHPISDGLATKATDSVLLKGTPHDPDAIRGVRMLVWMSTKADFSTHRTFRGTFDPDDETDKVTLEPLEQDTRYYLRLYSQSKNGDVSSNYTSTNFWTNRRPDPPTLVSPPENAQVEAFLNVTFDWTPNDPDPSDPQKAFRFRYRTMATPLTDAGEWVTIEQTTSASSWVVDAGTFAGNTFYEWNVRTQDQQNRWGEWQFPQSFFVIAATTPPELLEPIKNEAIVAAEDNTFRWKFKSPGKQVGQQSADLRYRVVGATDWIVLFGDPFLPGSAKSWLIPAETFAPGYRYEWQSRTTDVLDNVSEWCESSYFWSTERPGSGAGLDPIISDIPALQLGQGHNRAMVFQRGGEYLLGELTPLTDITWNRKRDDIATCVLHMDTWDADMAGLLRSLRSWRNEIVVFREANGQSERVAEGPITRISSRRDGLEIEFRDVMAYAYRRIMRQGYNDTYRVVDGQQMGLTPVTRRARQILLNALAYDDPNVLPYVTMLQYEDDARNSRNPADYSSTAWAEIDDLAAHAGLDYTCVGRRIILWDTHRPVGRLPEMRDNDFDQPPIITEYGANLANVFAVTNGTGIWGQATRGFGNDGLPGPEGFIEQLASSYSENEGAGTERTLTRKARQDLIKSLTEQAQRNIGGRYTQYGPSPKVVRVPDNSTLVPTLQIGINQLVPGVWIPLRCDDGIQEIAQWQKLDSVTVTEDKDGEKVSVIMSPAPNNGEDPDADAAAEED